MNITPDNPTIRNMVEDLKLALGPALHSVVLYGSAARGDWHERTSDLNLLVVLRDLEPATLERLTGPFRSWERKGQPPPRLLSPALVADAADVFPIELLDLRQARVVVHGEDAFADVRIDRNHLRLQLERELREKMMRLREAYVVAHARERDLERLLTDSYTTFTALFRGALHLLGETPPVHNDEVVRALARRIGVDPDPFAAVDRLKRGERVAETGKALFSRYHAALASTVAAVDRAADRSPEGGQA